MAVDQERLQTFMGRMVGEFGAVASAALILLGDKLGLYQAMAGRGPMTSSELATRTGMTERYLREWLSAQAAAGFVEYQSSSQTYELPAEQALCFADETSPVFIPGFFQVCESMFNDLPLIEEAFRTGKGVGWHQHSHALFHGTERFFRPGYAANLISTWIPALDGVDAKLKAGASVADVGCGHGSSTILMAQAYPQSTFVGFDYHEPSIQYARRAAEKAEVTDRVRFEVAAAKDFPGRDYELVTFFDCLHDMGDPIGAAEHVRQSLKPDGTWMIVEPFANDRTEDNFNPVGRIFYAASTLICTPASLSQDGQMGLGAQAGEKRLKDVVVKGGFRHFRRATETPFNLILEARP
ncbi:class I SAM-dependent methyltransferase [Glaciimonas sp. CA11.2]|uniref:class I SAM-dependent methyltransferase n=1 Tax=Glaciimonas sp. CA11.2 TaxID=3048601 RepID=UPI002AB51BDB|nr:class I SAM-dependent methyltransferase [Glaciimonas sp. CA11.2]MDY7545844.1 class I SAM-dependent methyltransferase [Glaciimonas sp. CA11.2]MEB0161870.1 class I SAM-dependent methyltransferase [Glaciimonas sp. CA11.2]